MVAWTHEKKIETQVSSSAFIKNECDEIISPSLESQAELKNMTLSLSVQVIEESDINFQIIYL